ncbi:MAG: DUF805 domain-containing protein [Proteobacteria bacterium]|nr:DUF805 domain-containing protein [Pseudomonadota bacterium]
MAKIEKTIFGWYAYSLSKCVTFSGRARRKEYWYFTLANTSVIFAIAIAIGDRSPASLIFTLMLILLNIAVAARRLHDTGHPGWWQLYWFVPLIGWFELIVLFLKKGDAGANQYGPDPKAEPLPELPPNA